MQVLIPELDRGDIAWLWQTGEAQLVAANTTLIQAGQPLEALHFLIDGALTVQLIQSNQNPLGQAFAALEGGTLSGREILRLQHARHADAPDHDNIWGQLIAEVPLSADYFPATQVVTTEPCQILTIPQSSLRQRIRQDNAFAARIYQISATLLAQRFAHMLDQLKNSSAVLSQPQLREALLLFAELHDSDLDWLLTAGQVQKIPAQTVLMHQGDPIEAFHILLAGTIVLTASNQARNTLTDVFAQLEATTVETPRNQGNDREFSRLFRGDILGEQAIMGIPASLLTATVQQEAQILSIHRWRLESKLQHDPGFAARFYRVLAMLLSDRVLSISQRLGYGRLTYSQGDNLDQTFANELSSQFLSSIHIAGARFDWMLKRTQEN
jgi:bacteriocin-type transport-associated protein